MLNGTEAPLCQTVGIPVAALGIIQTRVKPYKEFKNENPKISKSQTSVVFCFSYFFFVIL